MSTTLTHSCADRSRGPLARFTLLAYSSVIYALFLVTFTRVILFVQGLWLEPSIDVGPTASVSKALLINTGLLGLFAVQHTIMARRQFKERWTRIIAQPAERPTFVLATCLILLLLVFQWRPLPEVLWSADGSWAVVLRALSWSGWGLVLVSSFLIDHFDLFGLRQGIMAFRGMPYTEPRFHMPALYRRTRHPLYLGLIVAFWSAPTMTQGHLFFAVVTTLYVVVVGIRLEERDLVQAHGESYARYRRSVPMLFPRLSPERSAAAVEARFASGKGA